MRLNIKLPDHTGTQPQPLLFVNMAQQPQVFEERNDTVVHYEFAEKQRAVVLPAFLIYAAKNEPTQIFLHFNHPLWDVKRAPISYLRLLHS